MTLSAGTRLGPYEITAAIGAGGMGEVYRARDATLNRDVAIKVLPAALAEDGERLARFKREAQVLASLNHPNIAHVYGFESATLPDGSTAHFLAMELVEGEDLAGRLKRGAIPIDESLAIAKQIAEGLEEAHEHGIIHRDLKPANVKVTPDGRAKVLDFGLAKAVEGDSSSSAANSQLSHSPTMSRQMTEAGMIMGTAAYMSPEQARGKPLDKRADIWAFGVLLFEMLTGERLFTGETVSDVLAAVLTREVRLDSLPKAAPRAARDLLRRCLERDPRRRLRDIGDARLILEDSGTSQSQSTAMSTIAPAISRKVLPGRITALVLFGLLAGVSGYLVSQERAAAPVPFHLAIHLAANQQLEEQGTALLTFSPDGLSLVFQGREDGKQFIFRRSLGESEARPIPGTEGGSNPAISPDGKWLTFSSVDSHLSKVAVEGGRPFPLANAQGAGGSAWVDNNTIVFTPIYTSGLFRMSADGGATEELTVPDHANGELGHWWPEALPGGRLILFTAFKTPVDQSRIGVFDLKTRAVRWVIDGGFFARYSTSGHLLYAKGARLYLAPFDAAKGLVQGPPVAVLDDVGISQTGGSASVAISSRGALAYITQSLGSPPGQLFWFDRTGRETEAFHEQRRYQDVSLSSDDERAVVTIQGDSQDLWMLSLRRGALSRLTSSELTEWGASWSRDEKELFYVVDRPPYELHRMTTSAPDSGQPLWDEPARLDTFGVALSPDRRTIAFVQTAMDTGADIFSRPMDGSAPSRPIRATRAEEKSVSFSPDGRHVVYQSSETGRPEIYVESFPASDDRAMVSANGGVEPYWAQNGELFFRHDDEFLVATPRRPGSVEFEPPRTLFRAPVATGNNHQRRSYAVIRDGSRLLAIMTPEANQPRQIEVVTDWASGLSKLAPRASK